MHLLTRHFIEKNTRAACAFRHKIFPKHTHLTAHSARANQSSSQMRVVASTLLVVLSFLLRPLQVLLEKTKSTTSSRRRRRGRRLQSGEEENNEDELLFSLSADETKWLFPHRIDPLLIEEEDLRTTVRSGRSERSCHVWFENGCVRFFFALFVCVRCGRFFLSLVFSQMYSLNAHLSMSLLLLLLRKIKNTRERSNDVDRLRRQSSAV